MILVAVLLVGGSFVLAEYKNQKTKIEYTNTVVSSLENTQNSENSVNWKKILLANEQASTTVTKDLTQNKEKLSQTDMLGRDFFAKYMELRQTGIANDKASQEDLVSQVLKNGVMLASPKTYTENDIITSDDTSKEALIKYGNDAGIIFKKNSISSRNEAVIAKDAIDKDNPKILEELDPIIRSYRNILNGLLKVRAPQSMSVKHLDLINSISSLVFIVENLRKVSIDPLAGVQAIARYTPTIQQFSNAIINIKNQFILFGIKYSSSDGGSFFLPN